MTRTLPLAHDIIKTMKDTQRPLIHHINADTSWLLQIPRTEDSRPFFNILIDPWLKDPQIEFGAWIHKQSHTIESAFQTIAEIDDFLRQTEELACKYRSLPTPEGRETCIDIVLCSMPGTDHANKATLLQLHPSVPIFQRPEGVNTIKKWSHFETVEALQPFEADWRKNGSPALPSWLAIGTLAQKNDIQGIHKGLAIAFDSGREKAEAVIYMAHGVQFEDLNFIAADAQDLEVLALLHGLLHVQVGFSWLGWSDANRGGHHALKTQRLLNAKYCISTHDEFKVEGGFTSFILKSTPVSIEEALERERLEGGKDAGKDVVWHDIPNGGGLVLA